MTDLVAIRASARRLLEIAAEVKNKNSRRDIIAEAAAILMLCGEKPGDGTRSAPAFFICNGCCNPNECLSWQNCHNRSPNPVGEKDG